MDKKIASLSSIQDSENEVFARTQRVKQLKNMMNMTLIALARKHDDLLVYDTLRGWHSPSGNNALSPKGTAILTQVAAREGIKCSYEWLYYGIGAEPTFVKVAPLGDNIEKQHLPPLSPDQEEKQIFKEALAFQEHHPDAIIIKIEDNGMSPFFQEGDRVGGVKRFQHRIQTLLGMPCIVETVEGEILVRELLRGSEPNQYTLSCTNRQANIAIIIPNVFLKSAAPIIWHRRKEPLEPV